MQRLFAATLVGAALIAGMPALAQAPASPPPFATTKVEGTDNVYIFRALGAQAMFVVTPDGVIATDPISYARRDASTVYLQEIRKITDKPVKYVVYSHHHYDHIAGGKPFKDQGAVFVSHQRAKERLTALGDSHTTIPDETFRNMRTITLGGTTLELRYLGLNHSDSTIVMRLPREKIVFAVDFVAAGTMPGRGMIDSYPIEWEASLKRLLAMDWDRLIPGHPGPGGRLGTKKDVQDYLSLLQDASAEMKGLAQQGKCWDTAENEMKLEKWKDMPGFAAGLPFVARRYCGLWGRGT